MSGARKRRRARRRKGVVLTEALIVIGMLTVLLFGVSFFHQMYAAKADTMQRARLQAWAGTRLECSGDSVRGEAQVAVAVPAPILMNAAGPPQRTIKSRASLACNIDPDQNEDVVSVLGWALKEGASDLSGVFSGVGSDMLKQFAQLANPLNWF